MGGCLLGSHPLYNRVSDCLLEVLSIQKPLSGEEGWEESLRVGNRRSAWGRRKDSLTEQKWSSFVQMNELSRARASSLLKNSQVFLANPCLLSFLFINSLPTPTPTSPNNRESPSPTADAGKRMRDTGYRPPDQENTAHLEPDYAGANSSRTN